MARRNSRNLNTETSRRRSAARPQGSGTRRASASGTYRSASRSSGRTAYTAGRTAGRRSTTVRSSQHRPVQSRNGRQRVITPAEQEARRRRQLQARRRKEARRRAYQAWALVLLSLVFCVVLCFRGLSFVANYINTSRQNALDAMQNIDIERDTAAVDVADERTEPAASAASGEATDANASDAASEASADTSDPTHVLSNGRYIDTTKPMVALTWDDGPKPSVGNHLMDLLEANNGRGTFFIVGERIDQSADEVKRMAADGHEIGNHSWDHDEKLSKRGSDYIRNEFDKTNQKVAELTGITPALIRLPGGIVSDDVRNTVTQPMIYWSVDTLDWKTRNAQSTIDAVQSSIKDGDIVLMHELYDATSQACDTLIPWLNQQGYQLVTVSELIQFRNAEVVGGNGKQYECFRPQETTAAETSAKTAAESAAEAAAAEGSETETAAADGAAAEETESEATA